MNGSTIGQRVAARLFDAAMAPLERRRIGVLREDVVSEAQGDVLEVGAGTGVNFARYRWNRLTSLHATDWVDRRVVLAERFRALHSRPSGAGTEPRFAASVADVQELPFPDASFDTVVATLLFCSVPDAHRGLAEVRRVLRPGGRYLFIEHVVPDEPRAAALFHTVNPVWRHLAGGCNLTRDTARTIVAAGFRITRRAAASGRVFIAGVAEVHPTDAVAAR